MSDRERHKGLKRILHEGYSVTVALSDTAEETIEARAEHRELPTRFASSETLGGVFLELLKKMGLENEHRPRPRR